MLPAGGAKWSVDTIPKRHPTERPWLGFLSKLLWACLHSIGRSFCPTSSFEINTWRLIINCKCLTDSSGLILANSCILNKPIFLIYPQPVWYLLSTQHTHLASLCISHNSQDSALLLPAFSLPQNSYLATGQLAFY